MKPHSIKKWIIIIILIKLVFIAGLYLYHQRSSIKDPIIPSPNIVATTPSPTPIINVDINQPPQELTLDGEYTCLPHKNTSGPQTLECALGLKLADGTYVATDMGDLLNTDVNTKHQTGSMVRVTGLYVPAEQLNTDQWQKYPIKGILKASNVVKL
jgi:hypothetical protein